MGTLDGKAAIVTGAGQGLGRGVSLALAAEGASLGLLGRTATKLEGVAAEIADRGGKAVAIACDVTSPEQVEEAVSEAVAQFGTVDILVNAAQDYAFGGLADIDLAGVENAWQSGPMGTLRMMRAALPHLRDGGSIVNVSSGVTSDGDPGGVGAYAATKAATETLTRAAAVEWAAMGVRANVVIPFVKSPSVEAVLSSMPGAEEHVLSEVPLGRWGDAETDAGRAVAFLCGPDASFITGATLVVDGGSTHLR